MKFGALFTMPYYAFTICVCVCTVISLLKAIYTYNVGGGADVILKQLLSVI